MITNEKTPFRAFFLLEKVFNFYTYICTKYGFCEEVVKSIFIKECSSIQIQKFLRISL